MDSKGRKQYRYHPLWMEVSQQKKIEHMIMFAQILPKIRNGLTTLKNRHVDVYKEDIRFSFKGKSGIYHDVQIKSKKVAKIIKQCQDLPGQDLFEYKDQDGKIQSISSQDVSEYLKEISQHLRNLPSTCRKYYIHPAIFDAFTQGYTLSNLATHGKFKNFVEN